MAVEIRELAGRSPIGARHAKSITKTIRCAALHELAGLRRNILAHRFEIALISAIRDEHCARAEKSWGSIAHRRDSGDAFFVDDETACSGATKNLAAPLLDVLLEALHGDIGAAPFPVEPRRERAPRRENPLLVGNVADTHEFDAFVAQPVHRPRRVIGERFCQFGLCLTARRRLDYFYKLGRRLPDVVKRDMQDAAGKSRIAWILLIRTALQHGDVQSRLRGAARRGEAGDSAADDNQIVWGAHCIHLNRRFRAAEYLYCDHQAQAAASFKALQRLQGRRNRHFLDNSCRVGIRCRQKPASGEK